jgi:hypothetical protein
MDSDGDNISFLEVKQVVLDDKENEKLPIINKFIKEKIIILFDLNGTLCYRNNKTVKLRPNIEKLSELSKHFVLGIYTSVTLKNACKIIKLIEDKCGKIFDEKLIFTREDTIPFTNEEIIELNIPPYKTKKSIEKVIKDYTNVCIVDDEIFKIIEQENSLIVPKYNGEDNDEILSIIISTFIHHKYNDY